MNYIPEPDNLLPIKDEESKVVKFSFNGKSLSIKCEKQKTKYGIFIYHNLELIHSVMFIDEQELRTNWKAVSDLVKSI